VTQEFWWGILIGAIGIATFGFVATQYIWFRGRVGRFFRPQAVVLQTRETPAQIFGGCVRAILRLLFILVLIFAVWLLIQYLYG
jgi:hypothetical protein